MADFPSNLTWDEFLSLPQETRNAALIDGEVVVNSPNAQHEWIVRNLTATFLNWMWSGANRGDISYQQPVQIHERRGYQPDFVWYPQELCAPPGQPREFSGPPHLVVEILSPSTRRFDLVRKRHDYEEVGIAEVWFVSQDQNDFWVLQCQRNRPDGPFVERKRWLGELLASPVLQDFEVPVDALFRL